VRFLVVDDHAIVRRGVRELLGEAFPECEVVEAATGEDAMREFAAGAWDLIVLDLAMPGGGGLEALKRFQSERREVPVLVLSAHAEEQYAVRALRAGARGYVTKQSASEELVLAVRKLLAGTPHVSAVVAERIAPHIAREPGRPPHETLSDREMQVFRMLVSGRSVKEIGAELGLSDKTISTYRARVLEKMKLRSNAELMAYAYRSGLMD
jgi:two-component system, NarL family, invasion response regulator UvrY